MKIISMMRLWMDYFDKNSQGIATLKWDRFVVEKNAVRRIRMFKWK